MYTFAGDSATVVEDLAMGEIIQVDTMSLTSHGSLKWTFPGWGQREKGLVKKGTREALSLA